MNCIPSPPREKRERFSKSYPFFHVQLKSHLVFPITLMLLSFLPDLSLYYLSIPTVTVFFWISTLIKTFLIGNLTITNSQKIISHHLYWKMETISTYTTPFGDCYVQFFVFASVVSSSFKKYESSYQCILESGLKWQTMLPLCFPSWGAI